MSTMEAKRNFTSWRELLGHLIKNPPEKQRLSREVGVKPITLKRWVSGESQPREENIRQLLRALVPDLSVLFQNLVEAEFPSFTQKNAEHERIVPKIPSDVYAQVMQVYTQTPPALVHDTLYTHIFTQALEHLDPDRSGMSLVLIGCMPPLPGQHVRSLRQLRGMGSPPWERDLERRTIFLGSESVAGSAVMSYRAAGVGSRDAFSFTPANWTEYEQSAIASPILRQASIAGALLASSARPHYFTTMHQGLLDLYAHLSVLLFNQDEFYRPAEIMLRVMPPLEQQIPYFANFEQRVALKFSAAAQRKSVLTRQQAHQLVWQDIEEELLLAPSEG